MAFCTSTHMVATLVNAGTIGAAVRFDLLDDPTGCVLPGSDAADLRRFVFTDTIGDWDGVHYNAASPGTPPAIGWASNIRVTINVSPSFTTLAEVLAAKGPPQILVFDGNGVNPVIFTTPSADPATLAATTETGLAFVLGGNVGDGPGPTVYTIVSGPSHGALTGVAPNLTYTSNANYVGADSFTFTIDNGANVSPAATVTIGVLPIVTDLSPAFGPLDGGTPFTITGLGLQDPATVTFGGTDAGAVVVSVDGHTITGTTPAHAYGAVSVVVDAPGPPQDATQPYVYFREPNIYSSPPWQTPGQWAIHQFDIMPRREGPTR